jgi:hypothetical protein
MKAKRRSRVDLSGRVPIRETEKELISSTNNTGLQVKLLNLPGVVRMLPSGREGVGMNGFLAVISQTTCRLDLMLGIKRCIMYELSDCSG